MLLTEIGIEFILVTLSLCILHSAVETNGKTHLLQYIIAVFIVHVAIDKINSQLCILFDMLVIFLLNIYYRNHWSQASYFAITISLVFTIIAILSGSLENFLTYPLLKYDSKWRITITNVIIFVLCVTVSTVLNKSFKTFREPKSMIVLSAYNFVILLIFYFGTPYVNTLDKENMLLILLILNLILAGIGSLILSIFINSMEQSKMEDEILMEKTSAINKEQAEVQILKHIFASRYQSMQYFIQQKDIEGLTEYFNEYIEPFQKSTKLNNVEIERFESINDKTIKVSVFSLIYKCNIYNIPYELDFGNIQDTRCHSENDLITILGIYSENAFYESRDIENAFIKVKILQDTEKTIVEISNTYGNLSDKKNMKAYDMPIMEKRYGKGILIAQEISNRSTNLYVNIWKDSGKFIQQVIVKRK